jgi:hypothetical protein
MPGVFHPELEIGRGRLMESPRDAAIRICKPPMSADESWTLYASEVYRAAPSALNYEAHPYPGLTAGPINCRPFGPYQALNQAGAIAVPSPRDPG